jgi:alpha-N-acetylglucosaminidase
MSIFSFPFETSSSDLDTDWHQLVNLWQDHNHDYIVVLPDWDPSTNIESGMSNHQKKIYFLPPGNRRYLFQQTPAGMPQAHLWYPPEDVIKALQLFLAGGKHLTGSLTYR